MSRRDVPVLPAVAVAVALAAGGCATVSPVKAPLAPGQHAGAFDAQVARPVHLPFLMYVPQEAAVPGAKLPLLLFLHGSGERGKDLEAVKRNGPPRLIAEGRAFPFFVASPLLAKGASWEPYELNALLDELLGTYPIDPDRVYVTGLSLGGYGAWFFATTFPERVAALAPICGWTDPESACRLKNVPVWAFHGAKDDVVPPKESVDMVDAVKACGGDARLTLYPDQNHGAWVPAYEDPQLYAWLLSKRRAR